MTADELEERASSLGSVELIDGEVVPMPPTGFEHGFLEMELGSLLRAHVRRVGHGVVVVDEVGYRLSQHTVRAADVALHLERPPAAAGFATAVPDLVAEIVSQSDTWPALERKALEWLAAGVREVWLVEPQTRTVSLRQSGGRAHVFQGQAAVVSEVLPDLSLRPSDLFEDVPGAR